MIKATSYITLPSSKVAELCKAKIAFIKELRLGGVKFEVEAFMKENSRPATWWRKAVTWTYDEAYEVMKNDTWEYHRLYLNEHVVYGETLDLCYALIKASSVVDTINVSVEDYSRIT